MTANPIFHGERLIFDKMCVSRFVIRNILPTMNDENRPLACYRLIGSRLFTVLVVVSIMVVIATRSSSSANVQFPKQKGRPTTTCLFS